MAAFKHLRRMVNESPLVLALWPDQLLWQYLLVSAKVGAVDLGSSLQAAMERQHTLY